MAVSKFEHGAAQKATKDFVLSDTENTVTVLSNPGVLLQISSSWLFGPTHFDSPRIERSELFANHFQGAGVGKVRVHLLAVYGAKSFGPPFDENLFDQNLGVFPTNLALIVDAKDIANISLSQGGGENSVNDVWTAMI